MKRVSWETGAKVDAKWQLGKQGKSSKNCFSGGIMDAAVRPKIPSWNSTIPAGCNLYFPASNSNPEA